MTVQMKESDKQGREIVCSYCRRSVIIRYIDGLERVIVYTPCMSKADDMRN